MSLEHIPHFLVFLPNFALKSCGCRLILIVLGNNCNDTTLGFVAEEAVVAAERLREMLSLIIIMMMMVATRDCGGIQRKMGFSSSFKEWAYSVPKVQFFFSSTGEVTLFFVFFLLCWFRWCWWWWWWWWYWLDGSICSCLVMMIFLLFIYKLF